VKRVDLSALNAVAVHNNTHIQKKVMLSPGELPPVVQFSQATFPPGESVEHHHHDSMHEVFFVQKGSGAITVEGHTYAVEAGSCLWVAAGESHSVKNTGVEPLVLLFFAVDVGDQDE